MSLEFESAVKQVSNSLLSFDKVVENRIKSLDALASDITSYLEISKNVSDMLQATGAEIEAKGSGNKTAVLGRHRGVGGKRQTGASLMDYYRKKLLLIRDIHDRLVGITSSLSEGERLDEAMKGEFHQEATAIDDVGQRGENRKVRRLKKIVEKSEKYLEKEDKGVARGKKSLTKEIALFRKVYKSVLSQSKRLKGLTRGFFAKASYNRLVRQANRERKAMLKALKRISKFMKLFKDETATMVHFLNTLVKELKTLGRDDDRIANLGEKLDKEGKHVKKIRKLERKERKFEKRIPKLHKLEDTHEREDVGELSDDLGESGEEFKEELEEEKDIERMVESLKNMDGFISSLLEQGARLSRDLSYFANYTTNQLVVAKGMRKKDAASLEKFLAKMAEFSKEKIQPLLAKFEEEDRSLGDAVEDGKETIRHLAQTTHDIIQGTDKDLHDAIGRFDKAFASIVGDLSKRFDNTEKEIQKLKRQEEKDKKQERKLGKRAKKTHLDTEKDERRDMKRQERNLDGELQEVQQSREKLHADAARFRQAISDARKTLPDFKTFSKRLVPQAKFRKLVNTISSYASKHGQAHEDSEEAKARFSAWTSNPYDIQGYVQAITTLEAKTRDDIQLLNAITNVYKSIADNRDSLSEFFQQLEHALGAFKSLEEQLGAFENDFQGYFDGADELFSKTREEYDLIEHELNEVKGVENSLETMARGSRSVIDAAGQYKKLIAEFSETAKFTRRKLGKEDWTGERAPGGVGSLTSGS